MKVPMKELQRKRMMSYFIEAAYRIIETEGIDALTVRKVADLAGYNSATIYNYFTNLEHLLSYASIRYLREYCFSLEAHLEDQSNAYERYLLTWEEFSRFSYLHPEIYKTIFFSRHSISEIFLDYCEIFPEDFEDRPTIDLPILSEESIASGNRKNLQILADEGFISKDYIEEINECIISLYIGKLSLIIERKAYEEIDSEAEVKKTVKYVKRILEAHDHPLPIPT